MFTLHAAFPTLVIFILAILVEFIEKFVLAKFQLFATGTQVAMNDLWCAQAEREEFQRVETELKELRKESNKYNNPDTFDK